jgi:hypothetical protein
MEGVHDIHAPAEAAERYGEFNHVRVNPHGVPAARAPSVAWHIRAYPSDRWTRISAGRNLKSWCRQRQESLWMRDRVALPSEGDMSQVKQTRRFGADDDLTCPVCGQRMLLSRRSPQPDYAADYEIQSFTCVSCDHELTRTVDSAGEPHEY